jgi:hypothetical protein
MSDDIDEKMPSIGISLQFPLQGQRQLVMQSFIDRDCDAQALNTLLDKLHAASERQYARGRIEEIKKFIEQEHINAVQQQVKIEVADESIKSEWENGSRRGEPVLTQLQIQKQREAYEIAEGIKDRVVKLNEELAKWEAKFAG